MLPYGFLQVPTRLADVESGTEVAVLKGGRFVQSATFSPDGKRVVTAALDGARLWDVESGTEIAVLRGSTSPVWSAAFSPDGKRVVTASGDVAVRSGNEMAWLRDAESGKVIVVLKGHTAIVRSAAFSPDGSAWSPRPMTGQRGCGTPRAGP